jgi:hypothetical protein
MDQAERFTLLLDTNRGLLCRFYYVKTQVESAEKVPCLYNDSLRQIRSTLEKKFPDQPVEGVRPVVSFGSLFT